MQQTDITLEHKSSNVNPLSVLSEVSHILGEQDPQERITFLHDTNEVQDKCKQKIPRQLVFVPLEKKPQLQKRRPPHADLSFYKQDMHRENPCQEVVHEAVRVKSEKMLWYFFTDEEKKFRAFTAYARGTMRYAKKMACKIQDTLDYLSLLRYETFALTITYDPKKHGFDRQQAWEHYQEHIHNVLEPLRKHHGLKYLWVLESTKNGYPHAHIVLAFPKGTVTGYNRMRNGTKVVYGKLYAYLKEHCASKIFYLEVIKGKNVKYYLTKYITKQEKDCLEVLSKKESQYSVAEMKMLHCLFACMVCNLRMFGNTRVNLPGNAKELLDEQEENERILKRAHRLRSTHRQNRAERAEILRACAQLLIKLCTNSPCARLKELYSISQSVLNQQKLDLSDKKTRESAIVASEIQKFACPLHCKGCFWSEFRNFIIGEPSKIYKFFSERQDKDTNRAMLSALQLQNGGEEFFSVVFFALNFFLDAFQNSSATFAEILEDENITIKKPYKNTLDRFEEAKDKYFELNHKIRNAKYWKGFKDDEQRDRFIEDCKQELNTLIRRESDLKMWLQKKHYRYKF